MTPAPFFSFPASAAFLRRLVVLLLSSTLVLFLAGSALAAVEGPRPIVADAFSAGAWEPGELPDVAVLISGVKPDDPQLTETLIGRLGQLPGVEGVVAERAPSGRIALHLSLSPSAGDSVLRPIADIAEQALPEAQISIGGRRIADRDLLDRLNRGTIVAVVPVVLLVSVLIAAAFGLRFGLAAGGTIALSTLLGGIVGARIAGPFDGSLGSTAVPAVMVAVLVSSVLAFRLLDWFKRPRGDDPADAVRNSVLHLLPEASLLFGGLLTTAVVLELVGSGRTPASGVAVGGLFASVVTLGALPALLAIQNPVPDDDDYRILAINVPDGRDLPGVALVGLVCCLMVLGLFAVGTPGAELLDESALAPGVTSRRVSEQLVEFGGDPSSAIVAELPASLPEQSVADWGRAVSELSNVGWVETSTGRYVAGSLTSVAASDPTDQSQSDPTDQSQNDPGRQSQSNFLDQDSKLAIVAPTVTPRSLAARTLVAELGRSGDFVVRSGFAITLSGAAVDAVAIADQGADQLWLLVLLLSATGALAILVLVNDVVLAAMAFGLRLLGTAALLGVYTLVASDVGGTDLQIAALVFGVGVGLFEIGFLRRIRRDMAQALDAPGDRSDLVGDAFRCEGKAAMLGLSVAGMVGLGFVASDLVAARQLGLAVAVGVLIELMIGTWLLRPAVMGERALGVSLSASNNGAYNYGVSNNGAYDTGAHNRHTDRRQKLPLPASLADALDDSLGPVAKEDLVISAADDVETSWRRIAASLLRSEFDLQVDPQKALLETVFVEGTPLFSELQDHNKRLVEAGLSVTGSPPVLRKVTAVNDGSPVTLAVTVDHPVRELCDRDGRILGSRAAERRDGMLWLVQDPSGRYRIAEAVDLGTVDLTTGAKSTNTSGRSQPSEQNRSPAL